MCIGHEALMDPFESLRFFRMIVEVRSFSWAGHMLGGLPAALDPVEPSCRAEQGLAFEMQRLCGKRPQAPLPWLVAFVCRIGWRTRALRCSGAT